MIYDKLERIGLYRGFSPWFDRAVDFLEKTDLAGLPLGRTEICGDRVFANVMEATALNAEDGKFEIHRKYMDIQIDIEGTEIIQIGIGEAVERDAFREENDFGTVDCPAMVPCRMGPGKFIVCVAEEPHMPGVAADPDNRRLKKCVIKVAANE